MHIGYANAIAGIIRLWVHANSVVDIIQRSRVDVYGARYSKGTPINYVKTGLIANLIIDC